MATVYLARDVKHDRQVALKVLKPELGAVLGVERFLSEIKVTANLQHPNLLPLFDSGEANGLLFYVMPFVGGESLRARLDREKQLPVDEAVRIAVAVGGALDYAHRHGVIHRDLKPENILLHDGQPVIADFGIALAVSNAGGARVTQTGLSLGTPQYMSPEQASGDRAIDARSDIYSLAAVTYEMIAGEAPHSGNTAQAIIAKLMTAEPQPLSTLRKSTPIHVEAAVNKALAKLPADRFSSAREFVDAMEGRGLTAAMMAVTGMRAAQKPSTPLAKHPLVLGLAAVAIVATGLAGYLWSKSATAEPDAVVRFTFEVPRTMLTANISVGTNMAVSPDGRTIAYAAADESGATRLFLRALDEINSRALTGTDGAQQPTFSPDGKWIAYLVGAAVWKVPVTGEAPISLGGNAPSAVGLAWSPSGLIIAGTSIGLVAVPASGGAARVVVKPDSTQQEFYFNQPIALADGETVLFGNQRAGGVINTRFASASIKTGVVTRSELSCMSPLGVTDGTLVYVTPNGALQSIAFDEKTSKVSGDPVALGVTVLVRVSGAADAALSRAGTLVYQSATAESQVGWVSESGIFTAITPMLDEPRPYIYPRLSPDAKRIALTIGTGGRSDVWLYDLTSGTPVRLTTEGTVSERPEWFPDGKRVVYRSDRGKRSAIWWQPADRSGPATPILASDFHDYFEGVVTPDGKSLVYQGDDAGSNQADVLWRGIEGDTVPKSVGTTNSVEAQPRISPDGKWVAFVTDASGTSQVVVQPFPGPGAQVQVTVAGGTEPVWSRDGKRLFYRDGRRLISASVTTTPAFAVTSRTPLFADTFLFAPSPHANYDVSLDGSKFLMIKNSEAPKLLVVHGWFTELKARLEGRR